MHPHKTVKYCIDGPKTELNILGPAEAANIRNNSENKSKNINRGRHFSNGKGD
jgi:hypothetical protein